ncbi:hypothetical protein BC832DRAFT_141771 [Gaertneriomyces semiglobifer]|nr:hypothetical protein BC832DRAFT_141771 [Gaertneriomyces semiglobifer]
MSSMLAAGSLAHINYANSSGIHSVAVPVTFVVVYALLAVVFAVLTARRRCAAHIILLLFCIIRIAAFAMRAIIAHSDTAGESLGFYLATVILYTMGFVGLLYTAYALVLDHALLIADRLPSAYSRSFAKNRVVVRLILIVAVSLGITGGNYAALASSDSGKQLGQTLKSAATWIFFTVSLLLLLQALALWRRNRQSTPFILLLVAVFLFGREVFYVATLDNAVRQQDETYFYPLAVGTELVAAILIAIPGVVPPHTAARKAVPSNDAETTYYTENQRIRK